MLIFVLVVNARRVSAGKLDIRRVFCGIPLQCVRTIAPERGWSGYFHTFAVFFVHSALDSVPFVGMRERTIVLFFPNHSNADKKN